MRKLLPRVSLTIVLACAFLLTRSVVEAAPASYRQSDSRVEKTKYRPCSELRKDDQEYGSVERKEGWATVMARGPSPMRQAVAAINKEYGWVVDFEEADYTSGFDLCQQGSMLEVAGTSFRSSYRETPDIKVSSVQEESVLERIVSEYNRSGNPGRFVIRKEGERRYAVVGEYVSNGQGQLQEVTPVLDTPLSLPRARRKVFETIDLIILCLAKKTGARVLPNPYPSNANGESLVGGQNVPAMVLLMRALETEEEKVSWTFQCDLQPSGMRSPCILSFSRYFAIPGKSLTTTNPFLTYNSDRYGISFRYPAPYILREGERPAGDSWLLAGKEEFQTQSHRLIVVTLSMPKNAYLYSNLRDAFFNITLNQHLTPSACKELLNTSDAPLRSTLINGVQFDWASPNEEGGLGTSYGETDYVTFQNKTCYEVTLGTVISVTGTGSHWGDTVVLPVDYKDVEYRLQAILATLKLRSATAIH
jgi:hypothetical protein